VLATLGTTHELTGGVRLKRLPLRWQPLSETQRVGALRALAHALTGELASHPEQQVHVQVAELTEEARALLDNIAREHAGRLTYSVVPEPSRSATARPADS
jgi:hypothetical protein